MGQICMEGKLTGAVFGAIDVAWRLPSMSGADGLNGGNAVVAWKAGQVYYLAQTVSDLPGAFVRREPTQERESRGPQATLDRMGG